MLEVDFGNTAGDYARHRAGFPDAFYERLAAYGIGRGGQRIVDLGTGTGTLARALARRGARVVGVDRSEAMLAEARRLDAEAGVSVDYVAAPAEATTLPSAAFDVVTAAQCWHWFDRPRATAEARRLLVPHGLVVIAHFDWIPLPGNVVAVTEALIEQHNPRWKLGGGLGIHPAWLRNLGVGGFLELETFSFDVDVRYPREAWRGRIRASAGVGASLAPEAVAAFDAELAQVLATRFPDDPLDVPHRVFAVIGRAPGDPPPSPPSPLRA